MLADVVNLSRWLKGRALSLATFVARPGFASRLGVCVLSVSAKASLPLNFPFSFPVLSLSLSCSLQATFRLQEYIRIDLNPGLCLEKFSMYDCRTGAEKQKIYGLVVPYPKRKLLDRQTGANSSSRFRSSS